MKYTIIPSDGVVVINGKAHFNIDMTGIDPEIHAVQWFGNGGDIEYVATFDGTKYLKKNNEPFTDPDRFKFQLDQWYEKNKPPPPPTLDELKVRKLREIKMKRCDFEESGVVCNGQVFNSDWPTYVRLTMALHAAEGKELKKEPFSVEWVKKDNAKVKMSKSDLYDLAIAIQERMNDAAMTTQILRDRVNAATSEAELNAISWPT